MTAPRSTLTDAEIDGTASPSLGVPGLPWSPPLPADLCRRAARTVAVNARDTAECAVLLAMLGLTA